MPCNTENMYRDTESRYHNDPAFRAAVKTLEGIAERHGFTPGELKQIAFKAALNIEERRLPRGFIFEELQRGEVPKAFRPTGAPWRPAGELLGHLKDGTPVYYGSEP
jgi:hypothetical protein